jgi:hypothetical protein
MLVKDVFYDALFEFFFSELIFFLNFLKKILKFTWKMVKNLSKSVKARELNMHEYALLVAPWDSILRFELLWKSLKNSSEKLWFFFEKMPKKNQNPYG